MFFQIMISLLKDWLSFCFNRKEPKSEIIDEANETVATLCKNYEKLCKEKYPEAPLPLEILDNKD